LVLGLLTTAYVLSAVPGLVLIAVVMVLRQTAPPDPAAIAGRLADTRFPLPCSSPAVAFPA
jgi:hypothetical protein